MMPEFRTPVDIKPSPWKTGYGQRHLFIGSCFTENIGEKMEGLKFPVLINPFGIVYNPVSVADSLHRLLSGKPWEKEELFCHNGLWHSFDHHGRYSSESADETLKNVNDALIRGGEFLRNADYLFLTFGTAWVFERAATGKIVANCHKAPAGEFRRFRLSVGEIVEKLRDLLEELWKAVPHLKVIFTVSPVRHLSDGAVENQVSKATLLLAVDALIRGYGQERCAYFPAYELVMDELRDYRFYASDMVHISPVATDFVWGKFLDWIVSDDSIALSRKVSSIVKAREHRPFNRNAPDYRNFLETNLQKIRELTTLHPELNLSAENEYFSFELSSLYPAGP